MPKIYARHRFWSRRRSGGDLFGAAAKFEEFAGLIGAPLGTPPPEFTSEDLAALFGGPDRGLVICSSRCGKPGGERP
jgi:hypothetical protein